MSERNDSIVPARPLTRRQMIAGVAVAFGSLAAVSEVWGDARQPAMTGTPSTGANETRTSLHQEIGIKASPQRIYEVLQSSKQFAACTGMTADIDPVAGGAFSMFNGMIVGRNVETVPNQRIVQAWRPSHWSPGIYSIVRFELKPRDSETLIVLDHTGFPEGEFDNLNSGWPPRYWEPLRKFLA